MKLVKLTCPNCNSILEVNEEMKQFTCNYCGTTTLLDDEIIKIKHISSNLTNLLEDIKDYYDNGNFIKCYEMANELLKEYPKNKKLLSYLSNKKVLKALDDKKIVDEVEKIKEEFDLGKDPFLYNYSRIAKKIINEYKKDHNDLKILEEAEKSIDNYLRHYDSVSKIIFIFLIIVTISLLISTYIFVKQNS